MKHLFENERGVVSRFKMFIKLLFPKKSLSVLKRAALRIYYFGYRYTCPLCKSRLRKLLPFGLKFPVLRQKQVVGGGHRHVLCPVCGCSDRERLLYLYLLNKTDVFKNHLKLLHIAPEPGIADIFNSKEYIDYVTADINQKNGMIKMDIAHIQFRDNVFDFIICNHVLEHVVDDRKAMRELYRILKPGGRAILQVPVSLSLQNTYEDFSITTKFGREEAFGQADHVRIYARDYKDRLEQAGFKVGVFQWASEGAGFNNHGNRFGLNEKEGIYFAGKF
jgi:SAM-dependent methyltransferase